MTARAMKATIAALVALSACSAAGDTASEGGREASAEGPGAGGSPDSFMAAFAGDPYMGRIGVGIRPPEDSGLAGSRDSGRGTLQIIPGDGKSARLILVGNIRAPGDAGFAVDGTYDDTGWRSESGDVTLHIARDGTVSGGGLSHPNRFAFQGTISKDEALIEVDIELLEATTGGLPVGTRFNFYYVLQRADPDRAEEDDGDCQEIRYRLQNVANPFGSSMGMVRVPYCVD